MSSEAKPQDAAKELERVKQDIRDWALEKAGKKRTNIRFSEWEVPSACKAEYYQLHLEVENPEKLSAATKAAREMEEVESKLEEAQRKAEEIKSEVKSLKVSATPSTTNTEGWIAKRITLSGSH